MEIIEKDGLDDLNKLKKRKKINEMNRLNKTNKVNKTNKANKINKVNSSEKFNAKINFNDIKNIDIESYLELMTFYNELFGHPVRKKKIKDKYMIL